MPDSTAMRRAGSVGPVAAAILMVVLVGCGHEHSTPGVARMDFDTKVELVLPTCPGVSGPTGGPGANATAGTAPSAAGCGTDDRLRVTPSRHPGGPAVGSVVAGSVLTVKNLDRTPRRVVGTDADAIVFDTGIMAPGNTTTVVLDTPGTVAIAEMPGPARTSLRVRPAPSS